MKDRQKKMLRFMLVHKGVVLIDDLAQIFSIGRRTVSRDLDTLDKWLSLRGARLERKPNQGIQVLTFGSDANELLEQINQPEAYLESLPPLLRQQLILLYLLFNNREIKISDIADTFFISDTSVWNDLNNIEEKICSSDFTLERQKGVGIRLNGEEAAIRLKFLSIVTETFSSRTIIPYLYALKEDNETSLETNQFKLLMKRLKFPVNSGTVEKIISGICQQLGYQFTMSGEALLYFYIQLTVHRVKSGAMIWNPGEIQCLPHFQNIGSNVLKNVLEKVLSGTYPEGEEKLLGLILQVLEIGDISSMESHSIKQLITKPIREFTDRMINQFGKLDSRMYYLNDHMNTVLNLSLASMINRLRFGIPYWHGEWGDLSAEDWGREAKETILSELLENHFHLKADSKDLEYLLLQFHSLVFSKRDIPEYKVRCLVCCFEGIGLASYLQSILQRDINEINIVEATAVFKIHQKYLDEKGIELILSTFPIRDIQTPVIPISLPINKEQIKKEISQVVGKINQEKLIRKIQNTEIPADMILKLSFEEIMSFISNFSTFTFPADLSTEKEIELLAEKLAGDQNGSENLAISFKKREDMGPLYFEEYGVRVLHCKSDSIDDARAGVVKFDGENKPRNIYMVAPDPCPDHIRKMLSVVTISFMENRNFRESIMSGSINQIRKNLMDIYKEMI